MSFFRKSISPDERPPAPEDNDLKTLNARKEQELRALGEIYYESTRSGRTDNKALARKMKDLEKLDARIDAIRAPRPPAPVLRTPPERRPATCGKCGAELTPSDRFCIQCGAAGPEPRSNGRPCPVCSRSVDEGARYCNHCGASMTQAGRIRIRHPLTGQEASFDFQPAPAAQPTHSYEPSAVELGPADYEDSMMDIVDDADPERNWIRELERFARPSNADVNMCVNRGKELLQLSRYREAAAEFEGAILQNARDPRSHYLLGIARYKSGDLDAAIEAFGRCVRLDRADADAYNDLGLCHAKKGESREAREQYQQALRVNPQHPDAHYNLAHLLIAQTAYPDAIHHLQMYLEFSPRAQDHKRVSDMIDSLQSTLSTGARMDKALPPR